MTTVVFAGAWPDPADDLPPPEDNRLAQPYGGYISPGSTLDEVRVFVSQWNTAAACAGAVPRHPVRGEPAQAGESTGRLTAPSATKRVDQDAGVLGHRPEASLAFQA